MTAHEDVDPWKSDLMNRKGVAKFLSQHLDAAEHIKVLNVNSEWGSGKTFFLQAWKQEQKPLRPCIYFDAWKHDYSGDPFVSLVATIREQLEDQLGKTSGATQSIKKFTASAAKTLVAATPVVAKGLVKKYLAIDGAELSEAINDTMSDAAEKAVEHLISSNKEALATVDNFKKIFNELLVNVGRLKNSGSMPAYIFIDELDRCRPTYAIELLERIKHLFDVSGCKFIIASDTKQLAHSINAVYGHAFESKQYLKRFFDAEFSLDNSNIRGWVKTKFQSAGDDCKAWQFSVAIPVMSSYSPTHEYQSLSLIPPAPNAVLEGSECLNLRQIVFLALSSTFDAKLRELEKIVLQLESLESNIKGRFHFFWGAYLIFLKDRNPDLYWEARKNPSIEVVDRIRAKYPASFIYFGDSNVSVHDLFHNYLNFFAMGKAAVLESIRLHTGRAPYLDEICRAFANDFNQMSGYFAIVDLAHRLE